MKRLTDRVSILAFELQRQRDEAAHQQKMAALEQENLLLRLQIALKKGSSVLPPSLSKQIEQNDMDNKNNG